MPAIVVYLYRVKPRFPNLIFLVHPNRIQKVFKCPGSSREIGKSGDCGANWTVGSPPIALITTFKNSSGFHVAALVETKSTPLDFSNGSAALTNFP